MNLFNDKVLGISGQDWNLGEVAFLAATGGLAAVPMYAQKAAKASAASQAKAQADAMKQQKRENTKSNNALVEKAFKNRGGLQPTGFNPTQGVGSQSGALIQSPTSGLADVLG